MNTFILILNLCFLASASTYFILIAAFTIAWYGIKIYHRSEQTHVTKVSVVIPARNEANNIIQCLEKITAQNYPLELFEIIIVDDCSSDETVSLIKDFIDKSSFKNISLIELSLQQSAHKKRAVSEAVKVAKGDLIITTDADCRMRTEWISCMADYYESFKPAMIAGPVSYIYEKGLFKKMQGLEFLSLIASGAASIQLGMPTMCNAANLSL